MLLAALLAQWLSPFVFKSFSFSPLFSTPLSGFQAHHIPEGKSRRQLLTSERLGIASQLTVLHKRERKVGMRWGGVGGGGWLWSTLGMWRGRGKECDA